jgi:hypothetical protein
MNTTTNEIQILNICNVMDEIAKAKGITEWWLVDYEVETQYLNEYCEANNYYLYERPRCSFNKWEGIELAQQAGCVGVILSDLS